MKNIGDEPRLDELIGLFDGVVERNVVVYPEGLTVGCIGEEEAR